MFIENQIHWHELGLSDLTLLGNNESVILKSNLYINFETKTDTCIQINFSLFYAKVIAFRRFISDDISRDSDLFLWFTSWQETSKKN